MAFALNFDKRLQQQLKELLPAPEYTWVTGWQPKDDRLKVDVVGLKDNVPTVLVEIELKKDNPVENVVKIWRWAKAKNMRKNCRYTRRPAAANGSCSSL